MQTAVQEFERQNQRGVVMFGQYTRIEHSTKGRVKVFSENQIVLYAIVQKGVQKRLQGFLFRAGQGTIHVPGVYPKVTLLVQTERRNQLLRLRRVLAWLSNNQFDLNALKPSFFDKLNSLLPSKEFSIEKIEELIQESVV